MFDPAIRNQSARKRRDAVAAFVDSAIKNGTFTYTDFLLAPEPMRSDVLEFLDGVNVENTIPRADGNKPAQTWDGQPLLLVHVEPEGRIRHFVREHVRIPGTNEFRVEKRMRDFGNVARVHDMPPERIARMILDQQGWPIVQEVTKGARMGSVVEWRWLEREANSQSPSANTVEHYQEILTRPSFAAEAAALGLAVDGKAKKSKAAGQQSQLGA